MVTVQDYLHEDCMTSWLNPGKINRFEPMCTPDIPAVKLHQITLRVAMPWDDRMMNQSPLNYIALMV